MRLKLLSLILLLFYCWFLNQQSVLAEPVAIDGVSGFVGSSLLKDLDPKDLRVSCFACNEKPAGDFKYFVGVNYRAFDLQPLLDGVSTFYQIGAIASIEARVPLHQYLLVNSLGSFLASRINLSMTLVVLSSTTAADLEIYPELETWMNHFVEFFSNFFAIKADVLIETEISPELEKYLNKNPIHKLRPHEYYGFSKLLLEKLLLKSSETRSGKIFVVRPALIVGPGIQKRQGSSVLKSIMDAIFNKIPYELWNRNNCFTPLNKLKQLLIFLGRNQSLESKFEVFDAGCVLMKHHDLGEFVLKLSKESGESLNFIPDSHFERKFFTKRDPRVSEFLPSVEDLHEELIEMVNSYLRK